jgi:hypothetical protein
MEACMYACMPVPRNADLLQMGLTWESRARHLRFLRTTNFPTRRFIPLHFIVHPTIQTSVPHGSHNKHLLNQGGIPHCASLFPQKSLVLVAVQGSAPFLTEEVRWEATATFLPTRQALIIPIPKIGEEYKLVAKHNKL